MTIITTESYNNELKVVNRKVNVRQPAMVDRKGPNLLHDNARPHVACTTALKLHELNIEVLSHPPYSPDLSRTDFHFFRSLGNCLKQKRFRKREDIENAFQ
ncbi:Histone-lysine N-methyltransferase SETMAR [Habropoda laboriosa]|uniref:Histone-lysine N-methyltransferase SETMAR n=1 Tax=Habropoda laboriosa TaxID=597456 RepID=A0A0L7QKL3_9HYME|nr:Histone-lysine N-methyltransferase SETMAR [Habropoda laboriosa]